MSKNNLDEWELRDDKHYVAARWLKTEQLIVHSKANHFPVRGRRHLTFTRLDTGEVLQGAAFQRVWRLATEAEVKAKKVAE